MENRPSIVSRTANRSFNALSTGLDPEKTGVGEMHKNFLGLHFAHFLRQWACSLVTTFVIITVTSLGLAVNNVEQATGVPQIFPPEHNQVMGKVYDGKFISFDQKIGEKWALKSASATECNDLFQKCTQFRCESAGRSMGSATECQCHPHGDRIGSCAKPRKLKVSFRVLARQGLPLEAVVAANFTNALATQFPASKKMTMVQWSVAHTISQCLVENWETGRQMLAVMVAPGSVDVIDNANDAAGDCEEKQMCYCGIERCEGSGSGAGYGSLKLGNAHRWSSGGRRLEAGSGERHPMAGPLSTGRRLIEVRPEDLVDVSLIFGMKVVGSNPLLGVSKEQAWEFEPNFNLQDPWAQRRFERLCTSMIDDKQLSIGSTRCWLLGFRDYWIKSIRKDWPVRPTENIDLAIQKYARSKMTDGFQTTTFMWFEGEKVRATYIMFFLNVPKSISAGRGVEIKDHWDDFVKNFNEKAESAIKGIWHASRLWQRAEAEKVILDSTVVTLGISLGCVFFGIFIFTMTSFCSPASYLTSVHIAFLVMMVVMSIIICLAFFMVVVMQWPIGAIEVLSLIVFVGFAVDYCLHVAHKYHACFIKSVTVLEREEVEDEPPPVSESPHSAALQSASFGRRPSNASSRSSRSRPSVSLEMGDTPSDPSDEATRGRDIVQQVQDRPEERFKRTQYALERMGGAVMGSAVTTVGCSAFLLPCKLEIFTKIGYVVMAVTIYAIMYTLLPLPSLLILIGPCKNDYQSLKDWVQNKAQTIQSGATRQPSKLGHNEDIAPRRYVLHMPSRAMSAVGPGVAATRTRVTATG